MKRMGQIAGWLLMAALAAVGDDRLLSRTESWQGGTTGGWKDRDPAGMDVGWSPASPDGGALEGTFPAQWGPVLPEYDAFVVDAGGSHGKFVGDCFASGLVPFELSFDLLVTGGELPSGIILRLAGNPGGESLRFWTSVSSQLTASQQWVRVRAPLDFASGAWKGGTAEQFAAALSALGRIEVQALRKGEGAQAIRIDNFSLVRRVPGAVAAADSDGDALGDYWEEAFFGNATNATPADDVDGDGMPNRDEFAAGTDPTDEESVLRIRRMHFRGAWNAVLNSELGIRYCPVAKSDLHSPDAWSEVGGWISGNGGFVPVVATNNASQCHMRVKAGPAPPPLP